MGLPEVGVEPASEVEGVGFPLAVAHFAKICQRLIVGFQRLLYLPEIGIGLADVAKGQPGAAQVSVCTP